MAKTLKIIAVLGCIHLGTEEHLPGRPAFDCEHKEAKRLIELGVAAIPSEETPAGPTAEQLAADEAAAAKAALLAAIAATETADDLLKIMPENEPDEEISAAFVAKMTELDGAV